MQAPAHSNLAMLPNVAAPGEAEELASSSFLAFPQAMGQRRRAAMADLISSSPAETSKGSPLEQRTGRSSAEEEEEETENAGSTEAETDTERELERDRTEQSHHLLLLIFLKFYFDFIFPLNN